MTNRDVYGEKILDIICVGERVAIDKKTNEPVVCSGFHCHECLLDGGCTRIPLASWLNAEYVEPQIDWSKVAVDTPILVKECETDGWVRRYFAKYKNGKIFAFVSGSTSWTSDGSMFPWKYGKLAEVSNE